MRRASISLFVALLACGAYAPQAAAVVANPNPALIERWEPCEPNTGVTVVVDYQTLGSKKVDVGCAVGPQEDGVVALQHAGFALEGTTTYGLAFICRIDGEPSPAEQSCTTTPGPGAYWSYWRAKVGGRWGYSGVGASSPQSRSPVGSVEGWSFGGGAPPRIEAMDGSGPKVFHLPPEQESSVVPELLARSWLAPVLDETAEQAEEREAKGQQAPKPELALQGAVALAQAGGQASALAEVVHWLACNGVQVETCPLPFFTKPEQSTARLALVVLGLQALAQNPSGFAGMNYRGELEGRVEASGKVKSEEHPASEAVEVTAPTVLALARTGKLSAKALKTVELILAHQNATTGGFEGVGTIGDVEAVEALVAARGASGLGTSLLTEILTSLTKAGTYLESIQEKDGGFRDGGQALVESTALGAVGLTLSGDHPAAERAAKWASRYQVTAEYAGEGNPQTKEHTPAEDVIGAFLPEERALSEALSSGVKSEPSSGVFFEAQAPTIDALLALATAGPYGPYDATFDQRSLSFETRTVGSPSKPLAATLTNHDVRSITISGISVGGHYASDFSASGAGCIGKTLAPEESCEVSASFDPTASGQREAQLQATLEGSGQIIELAIAGTGRAREGTQSEQGSSSQSQSGTTSSQAVLGSQIASPACVAAQHLDGDGSARGLVGVSWRTLEVGAGLRSWSIASKMLGAPHASFVTRATGIASVTSALLKLPAGTAYELLMTCADVLGQSSTAPVGSVIVPYDDRWSGLHYGGNWRRLKQASAWLGTISRGTSGATVTARLPAGRPVFVLRSAPATAKVEALAGSRREVFTVAKGSAGGSRQIVAWRRPRAGVVTLRVLKGMVDLDGMAVEG